MESRPEQNVSTGVIDNGAVLYTPNANFNGVDQFTYCSTFRMPAR
jgi:hypothetical protein